VGRGTGRSSSITGLLTAGQRVAGKSYQLGAQRQNGRASDFGCPNINLGGREPHNSQEERLTLTAWRIWNRSRKLLFALGGALKFNGHLRKFRGKNKNGKYHLRWGLA